MASSGSAPGRTRVLFCGNPCTATATQEVLDDSFDEATRAGIEIVACPRERVPEEAPKSDVLVSLATPLDRALLERCPRVKVAMQHGVGVEGIDKAACTDLGIWVSNVPSQGTDNAVGVAELAIYLAIAALRRHNDMAEAVRTRATAKPVGHTLAGKRVLLVGYGGCGVEVADRLRNWKCPVSVLRNRPWTPGMDGPEIEEITRTLHAKGTWKEDRLAFARHADVVVLTAMAGADTAGMIDAEFLAACPDGVIIVNVARGILLDRDAIEQAIDTPKIGALALDVYWNEPADPTDPIVAHPKTYLTPHSGGATHTGYRDQSLGVVQVAVDVHKGLRPRIVLNAPQNPRVGEPL